ncbi:MAG: UDP-N-acetylmuramoyl-L-alanine--D-glutamate ligase, partial [Firmicutes bacterium]|nr:UDP-N-acetylmuramoyl-L-alanine--D-glutamate ligase [Bacillota bacterium]
EALGSRYDEFAQLGVGFQLGREYLEDLGRFEFLFVAPGVPKNLPEIVLAQRNGTILSSEMNLFFEECQARIIGITGSSGKTTTTTLVAELLSASGFSVRVGGNIGEPLLEEVEAIGADTWVVLELSSFQLQLLQRSPEIALVTNVSPNHLDIHPDMDDYIDAKKRIYKYQNPRDWLVVNADNEITRAMAEEAAGQVAWFSRLDQPRRGAYVVDDRVMLTREDHLVEVCHINEIRLLGDHNVENILGAVAVADLVGCGPEAMHDVITSFAGVAHRLEFVQETDGIRYYNDSKATTPTGTIAALHSFDQPLILIAGGYDKHLPFDEMAEVVIDQAKVVVLLGDTRDQIAKAIEDAGTERQQLPLVFKVKDMAEAVACARNHAEKGDAVLLSPACASYDMFRSFEERGDEFRRIVQSIATQRIPTHS